jgi:Caspase domain
MSLYALLIGINNYHPESNVRSLSGCHRDVSSMYSLLLEYFSDLIPHKHNLLVLLDEDASREKVIEGFRAHLSKAGSDDIVLIYYAGHGAQNITANEFYLHSVDGKDEGWVLYDSRINDNYDLADKEIAYLLYEFNKKHPHIVLISDSCYSGSLSRGEEPQARYTSGLDRPRLLSTYLNGVYEHHLAATGQLLVPYTNHILLSACDKTELALESKNKGGFFTHALLNILREYNGEISYSDLYTQTCAAIRDSTHKQHPQIASFMGADPSMGFLLANTEFTNQRRYPVSVSPGDNWKIETGIANGICTDMNERMPVMLYDKPRNGVVVGQAEIINLGLCYSTIQLNDTLKVKQSTYWGALKTPPLRPFFIYCSDGGIIQIIRQYLSVLAESALYITENISNADIEIQVFDNNLLIYETSENRFIQGVAGSDLAAVIYLLKIVDQIAHWNRLAAIENPYTQLPANAISLNFFIQDGAEWIPQKGNKVILTINEDKVYFRLTAGNSSDRNLYIALLYLSPNYGISTLFHDTLPIKYGGNEICLVENYFHLQSGINQVTDILNLLVSTEPIVVSKYSKQSLTPTILAPTKMEDTFRNIGGLQQHDWTNRLLYVHLRRNE